jgi:hypothetical protein
VPLATLYPDHDYRPVLSRDRAFHVLHCGANVPFNPAAARLMMTLPDTLLFFAHAAGPLIQNAVLKTAMDAGDPNAAVPYMEAADRFGVSRTHVRNLMNARSPQVLSGSLGAAATASKFSRGSGPATTGTSPIRPIRRSIKSSSKIRIFG